MVLLNTEDITCTNDIMYMHVLIRGHNAPTIIHDDVETTAKQLPNSHKPGIIIMSNFNTFAFKF